MRDTAVLYVKWFDGFTGRPTYTLPFVPSATHVVIDPHYQTLDLYVHNNTMRTRGVLKKLESLRPKLLAGFESNRHIQLF